MKYILNPFSALFGSSNDRTIKKMMRHVNDANLLEDQLSKENDEYFKTLKDTLYKK